MDGNEDADHTICRKIAVVLPYLVHPFFLLSNNIVSYKRDVACAKCLES